MSSLFGAKQYQYVSLLDRGLSWVLNDNRNANIILHLLNRGFRKYKYVVYLQWPFQMIVNILYLFTKGLRR